MASVDRFRDQLLVHTPVFGLLSPRTAVRLAYSIMRFTATGGRDGRCRAFLSGLLWFRRFEAEAVFASLLRRRLLSWLRVRPRCHDGWT